jgi:hypothetical protein
MCVRGRIQAAPLQCDKLLVLLRHMCSHAACVWALQAAPLQCDKLLIRQCRLDYVSCGQDAAAAAAAAAAATGGRPVAQQDSGQSVGGGAQCSSAANCLQRFVDCMRVTACPAKVCIALNLLALLVQKLLEALRANAALFYN